MGTAHPTAALSPVLVAELSAAYHGRTRHCAALESHTRQNVNGWNSAPFSVACAVFQLCFVSCGLSHLVKGTPMWLSRSDPVVNPALAAAVHGISFRSACAVISETQKSRGRRWEVGGDSGLLFSGGHRCQPR